MPAAAGAFPRREAFAGAVKKTCGAPPPGGKSFFMNPLPRTPAIASALLLAACAAHPAPMRTVFDGRPQYPVTVIPVSPGLTLRHVAGPPCDYGSNACPPIGSEGARTFSKYELAGASGKTLFNAPSMLSDPDSEPAEFRSSCLANDRIKVFASATGNTLLIVEDRSPAGPAQAHILLRLLSGPAWTWSQFNPPPIKDPHRPPEGQSGYHFPEVAGLSDTEVWLKANGKRWPVKISGTRQDEYVVTLPGTGIFYWRRAY